MHCAMHRTLGQTSFFTLLLSDKPISGFPDSDTVKITFLWINCLFKIISQRKKNKKILVFSHQDSYKINHSRTASEQSHFINDDYSWTGMYNLFSMGWLKLKVGSTGNKNIRRLLYVSVAFLLDHLFHTWKQWTYINYIILQRFDRNQKLL
jgi:hypothetical protein